MIHHLNARSIAFTSILVVCAVFTVHGRDLPDSSRIYREKLAIVPFTVNGMAKEESQRLTQIFQDSLAATGKFDVMPQDQVMALLQEAKFPNLVACDYSLCLSDIGKILGVQKVLHGSVTKRGKLFSLEIRIIDVPGASISYDKKSELSGEYADFLFGTVPSQARDLGEKNIASGTPWYVVTAAAVIFVSVAYLIYRSFTNNSGGDTSGGGSPSTQQ